MHPKLVEQVGIYRLTQREVEVILILAGAEADVVRSYTCFFVCVIKL